MKVKTILVGNFTNCYLIIKDKNCLIVDPGFESNKIIKAIDNLNLTPLAILITHNHFDHIGAKDELKMHYNIPIYDFNNLQEGLKEINLFTFETIYFSGHKEDEIAFYFKDDNLMLVGDFIFYEDIGRTDLDGGSEIDIKKSISKIKKYPSNTTLYPGHGKPTTLDHELKNNPYF